MKTRNKGRRWSRHASIRVGRRGRSPRELTKTLRQIVARKRTRRSHSWETWPGNEEPSGDFSLNFKCVVAAFLAACLFILEQRSQLYKSEGGGRKSWKVSRESPCRFTISHTHTYTQSKERLPVIWFSHLTPNYLPSAISISLFLSSQKREKWKSNTVWFASTRPTCRRRMAVTSLQSWFPFLPDSVTELGVSILFERMSIVFQEKVYNRER